MNSINNQTNSLAKLLTPSVIAGIVIATLSTSALAANAADKQAGAKLQTPDQVEQALSALLNTRSGNVAQAMQASTQLSNNTETRKKVDHSNKSVAELVLAGLAITSEAKSELTLSVPANSPAGRENSLNAAVPEGKAAEPTALKLTVVPDVEVDDSVESLAAKIKSVESLVAESSALEGSSLASSAVETPKVQPAAVNTPAEDELSGAALVADFPAIKYEEAVIKKEAPQDYPVQDIATVAELAAISATDDVADVVASNTADVAVEAADEAPDFAPIEEGATLTAIESPVIVVTELENELENELDKGNDKEFEENPNTLPAMPVSDVLDAIVAEETAATEAELTETAQISELAETQQAPPVTQTPAIVLEAQAIEVTSEVAVVEDTTYAAQQEPVIRLASVSISSKASNPTESSKTVAVTDNAMISEMVVVTDNLDANVNVAIRSASCPEDFNKVSIPVNGKLCQIFAADYPASMILFVPQTPQEVIDYYLASSDSFVKPKTIKQRTMLKSADNNTTLIISKDGGGTQVDILVKSPVS